MSGNDAIQQRTSHVRMQTQGSAVGRLSLETSVVPDGCPSVGDANIEHACRPEHILHAKMRIPMSRKDFEERQSPPVGDRLMRLTPQCS